MFLLSFLISLALFALFMTFYVVNPKPIDVTLPNGSVYVTSVAVLVALSVIAGAIITMIANLIGLGKAKIIGWKRGRRDRVTREVTENVRHGLDALLCGDLKRARQLLEKAMERDPFSTVTYMALADLAKEEENLADALKYLLKARELDEKNIEILLKLAAVYEAKNDVKGALDIYAGILDLDDDNRRALAAMRDLFIKQGRWKDAYDVQKNLVKLYHGEKAIIENDMLLWLKYEFAKLTASVGGTEKAKGELRDIIKEKPDFIPAHVTLGESLMAEGKFSDAADLWKTGFRDHRNAIFLIRLEDLYFSQDDPSQIANLMTFYKKSLLDNPRDLIIRLFYGKLCLRLEMADEALDHLKIIADSGADFHSLHILLAEAFRRKGRMNQAVDSYRKALGIGRTHRIPFVCRACNHEQVEWGSFCPSCNSWGSFILNVCEELDAAAKPVENFVLLG